MPHINIKKGHDLRIFCQPDKYIVEITNFETVAILPTDFNGVKPNPISPIYFKIKEKSGSIYLLMFFIPT